MSFALTTKQILARTKTVTRRTGWAFLKPGDLVQAVEKGMGLKKGERVKKLAVLRVRDVRVERLDTLIEDPCYGREECIAEGFPDFLADDFVKMFCESHVPMLPCDVTRIEFEYVD